MGFLLITHDLSTLRFMCDDVLVMHRGKERGAAAQICEAPTNAHTHELLASALSIDA